MAESRLRGGWASAALDGADVRPESVRDGSALDGPMGRVVAAALRLQAEVPRQVRVLETTPLQALARLHAVTAHGFVPDGDLGRPRRGGAPDDPLHLGAAPGATEAVRRLDDLSTLLVRPTEAPAVLVAAVVHGELLATRPFAWGSGLLARAGVRLVLGGGGDPDGLAAPEAGVLSLGAARLRVGGTRLPGGDARRGGGLAGVLRDLARRRGRAGPSAAADLG